MNTRPIASPGLALALALGLAACSSAHHAPPAAIAAASPMVTVRLHRPSHVGQRAHIAVSSDERKVNHTEVNGATARNETDESHTELDAVERVLAVDDRGRITSAEYTVARLVRREHDHEQALLSGGQVVTVVRAARSADAQVTLDGHPVEAPVRAALHAVVSLDTGSRVSDDEVFGSTVPRAVGTSWPINGGIASRDLRETAGIVTELSGETRIVRRLEVQHTDCVEVTADMHGPLTEMPGLPPGMTVRSGQMQVQFRGVVPTALEGQSFESGMHMNMNVVVGGTIEGRALQVTIEVTNAKQGTATPL